MTYPTLPLEAASDLLAKRRRGGPWSAKPFVHWIGNGERFDREQAISLLYKLARIRKKLKADPLPQAKGKEFEGPACAVVHQELGLPTTTAAAREFWLWLTFGAADGQFCEIVDWRFGTQGGIGEVNYGLTSKAQIWEGLFARLWFRGHIGRGKSRNDPYSVAKRGDMDIWRSHVIRQEYGRCASVAKALVRFQYPDAKGKSRRLKVTELRALAKRLRVLDASICFEMLDESAVTELIKENVAKIRALA